MTEKDIRREELIRQRAYQIWLSAGSPFSSDWDFWLQAEAELFPKWFEPQQKTQIQLEAEWGEKSWEIN